MLVKMRYCLTAEYLGTKNLRDIKPPKWYGYYTVDSHMINDFVMNFDEWFALDVKITDKKKIEELHTDFFRAINDKSTGTIRWLAAYQPISIGGLTEVQVIKKAPKG